MQSLQELFQTITACQSQGSGYKQDLVLREYGVEMPLTVIVGNTPGKTILLSGGVHGCEYCSIQAAIELASELEPKDVSGTLLIVRIANTSGFIKRLPALVAEDQKNLNRMFPGNSEGSHSERLASCLTSLQEKADFYIDMHGGDLHESMYPFVFIPGVASEEVTKTARAAAECLDLTIRVLSKATTGAYNSAAIRGTPSMLIERGGNGRWSRDEVDVYKKDICSVLKHFGMLQGEMPNVPEQREVTAPIYLESDELEGMWYPSVYAGQTVRQGDELGYLSDVFGQKIRSYQAVCDGTVLYLTVSLAVDKGTPLVAYG